MLMKILAKNIGSLIIESKEELSNCISSVNRRSKRFRNFKINNLETRITNLESATYKYFRKPFPTVERKRQVEIDENQTQSIQEISSSKNTELHSLKYLLRCSRNQL
jgi:hypothetical protein